MKTFTTILISLILLPAVFGQDIDKLDEKNGFKNFKFGDSLSKYSDKMEFINNDMFLYNGETPNELFGYNWSHLFLIFYGNKLGYAQAYWLDDKEIFNDIKESLIILFGKPTYESTYSQKEKAKLYEYLEWDGKIIKMTLRRVRPDNESLAPCDDCRMFLSINNKILEKQKLISDF
jgi:hypothetical protein